MTAPGIPDTVPTPRIRPFSSPAMKPATGPRGTFFGWPGLKGGWTENHGSAARAWPPEDAPAGGEEGGALPAPLAGQKDGEEATPAAE